jgi:hypothetical protein
MNGNPTITIATLHGGLCLSVFGQTADDTTVTQVTCNPADHSQDWTFITPWPNISVYNGHQLVYTVINMHSGKCLDLNTGTGEGDLIVQRTCNGGHSQDWYFLHDVGWGQGDSTGNITSFYNLVNYHSGLYLSDPHEPGGDVQNSSDPSGSTLYYGNRVP